MLVLVLALAIGAFRTADTERMFLFPRPIRVINQPRDLGIKTEDPSQVQASTGIETLKAAVSQDLSEFTAKGTTSQNEVSARAIGAHPKSIDKFSDFIDRASRGQDMSMPAEFPLDTNYVGFWQSGHEFTIGGVLIGQLTELNRKITYQRFRGYWVDYGVARIFFAQGVRMRFKLTKALFKSDYECWSWLGRQVQNRPQGVRDDDLVFEMFGVPMRAKLDFSPKIKDNDRAPALRRALAGVDDRFGKNFTHGETTVEPVFVQISARAATIYIQNSLRAAQVGRRQERLSP